MRELYMLVLSCVIIAGFFFTSFLIISGKIAALDPQTTILIGTVFGAVSTQAGTVISYWFGTTKTSAEKDKTIASITNKGETK
jgi:hypothetical protein